MPKQGGVRVVAGRFRGLRLETRPGLEVRPTADRVKESLFSILASRLSGALVVDCFAGTGSLGIEALSRGAERVSFVERDVQSLEVLTKNLEKLVDSGDWSVIRADALKPASWSPAAFPVDLILADPPYQQGLGEALLGALAGAEALRQDGRLVLEHETGVEPSHPSWKLADRRRYGDTTLSIYMVTVQRSFK